MYKKSRSIMQDRGNAVKQKPAQKSLNSRVPQACMYPLLLSSAVEVTLLDNFIFMEHGAMYHGSSFSFIFITEMTRLFLSASESQELCRRFAHGSEFQKAATVHTRFNPLNPELNPICYLLALLAHHFLHVSRIRVKSLNLRLLMSYIYIYIYIYGAPILDVSRSHTTTQHSR